MTIAERQREVRRSRSRATTRASILDAARRVAARGDARTLSLRAVAAEAGFAPAALYGYFRNKDDLLLALAAEDLASVTRAMREGATSADHGKLAAAAGTALKHLQTTETLAAAVSALPAQSAGGEAERLFNGKLIAALTALSEVSGKPAATRQMQADIVLMAASLAGLALFLRSGRLQALGFSATDMIAALARRFGL